MDVDLLTMPKKKAYKEWKSYNELIKSGNTERYVKDMKKLYNCIKSGRKIIDIFVSFKKTGVNEKGQPKLAIAPACAKEIFFHKMDEGKGCFNLRSGVRFNNKDEIILPKETFPNWETEKTKWGSNVIKDENLKTLVPIVPAKFMPKGKLSNYHVLWEVKDWKTVPKDPILLRKITDNLFVVLAVWDLTPIEQSIIRGRQR